MALYFKLPITIAAGKSLTFNNTLTFSGTDSTTLTFPTTSATIARTDAGQTFTGVNAFGFVTLGSGSLAVTTLSHTILWNLSQLGWASTGTVTTASTADLILTRAGAATLQLGAANAASPVAQTLQVQGSRAGTDANVAGGNLTIQSGIGTGNVNFSSLILSGMIGATATTSTAQTQAAGITIPGVVSGQLPGAVIGSAALATTATDGFLYITSCAGTPTGVPTAFTGRVPLVYDTTGNILWVYNGGWKQPKTVGTVLSVAWS